MVDNYIGVPEIPDTVAIDPTAAQVEPTVSIDTGDSASIPLPPETAAKRATRAQYGMSGIINKPAEAIHAAIKTGGEDGLRNEVATQLDAMKAKDAETKIMEMVQADPLITPATEAAVMQLAQPQTPTNPNGVLEDLFAFKYANSIYTVNNDPSLPKFTWLQEAMSVIPTEVQKDVDVATEAIAKYQFSLKQKEDAEALVGKQGTVPWLADQAKQLIQIYNEVKLRGSVEGSGLFEGGLLGENLDAQRIRLFKLPMEQYKAEYERIMGRLKEDNPSLAVLFAHSMTDMTTDEKALSNLFSIAAPFEGLAAAKGIHAGMRYASVNTAKSLVKSVARAEIENPHVTAASGVGDLTEAAVQKSAIIMQEQFAGAPNETKRAIENLTTNLRSDVEVASVNPARDGQGIVQSIRNLYESGENSLINAFMTWNRINRTPVATTSEDVARTLRENIRGEAKGLDNAVLDVRGDNKGLPIHEPVSNTHYYEVHLGTEDKEYFKSRKQAQANADLNGLIIRPTVSQRLAEINREIGQINKSIRDVEPSPGKYTRVIGENKLAGIKFEGTPPEAANTNLSPKEITRNQLREERASLVKQFPEANTHVNTPIPLSEGYEIVQKDSGAGYYIRMQKFIPETSDTVRNSLITTAFDRIGSYKTMLFGPEVSTVMPPSRLGNYVNAFFGRGRTPEETLSKQERMARFDATFTPGKVVGLIEENKSYLKDLHPAYHDDFKRILTFAQHETDPVTGKPGWFKRNPGEIQDWYMNHIRRPADKSEILAYFEFKKLIEFDRIFREAANFRNKARNGVEQHRMLLKNEQGETLKTGFFDGIRLNHFPGGKDDPIMLSNDVLGKEARHFADLFPAELKKDLAERIKTGELKVVEIWDPESHPLRDLGGLYEKSKPRYIISKNFEAQPISWRAINRTGAGHLMPDYAFYVKQAIIHNETIGNHFVNAYHGDMTAFPVATRALGHEVIADMEKVRLHMSAGDEVAAEAAHEASNRLPFDWATHKGWYEESRNAEGKVVPARFNKELPFRVVDKNAKIADIDATLRDSFDYVRNGVAGNSFRDGTKSGSRARMSAIEFTGERDAYDLQAIERTGSNRNPVYTHAPVQYIDPITAMDRGLSRIINTTVMDDYKYFSMEHWIEQARQLKALKADINEVRSAPLFHYYDPDPYLPNLNSAIRRNLENIRKAGQDFMGIKNDHDNFGQRIAQNVADMIYNATGSKRFSVLPMEKWATAKDPATVVRSVALHADMGMMNIPSFFTQFTTFGNILAMSPRHAPGGALAASLYIPTRFNKSVSMIAHLDKMASTWNTGGKMLDMIRVGWKPGWFSEATKMLDASGFALVGHEHAFMSTPVNMSLFGSSWKKALDFGMLPFKYGAQSTRVSGYYTAYLEWRGANPTAPMTRQASELIRARAGLLDHNMNRGANSIIHTGTGLVGGAKAVAFQFAAYNLRLAEMMFGKRLTVGEKARMFAFNSLMYGVPSGTLGLSGIPGVNWIREQAINGEIRVPFTNIKMPTHWQYIPGNDAISSTALEGGLAALTHYILADPKDTSSKNWYNFTKWGPGKGLEQVENALSADKNFWDVMGGASYSKLKDIVQFSTGMRKAVASMFMADGDPKAWTGNSRDVIDMARIMSSGNKAMQAYLAYNTGKWTNKNEQPVSDVGKMESLIISGLGLSPTEYMDMFDKSQIIKMSTEANKRAETNFVKEFRRHMQDNIANNKESALIHWNNAWASLYAADYPPDQYGKAMGMAMDGMQDKAVKVDWDLYTKHIPASKDVKEQMNTLSRTQQLRGRQQ